MSTRAETPLPSRLQIIETSLTVVYLGEADLQYVEPGWSILRARAFLEEHEFDVAPVRDRRPHLFVTLDELQGDDGALLHAARPIDASHLVTEGLGLADAIELLREHPWYFVMERDTLVGIVTRADLQRPAVGMVTFSLVLAAEAAMNRIIEGSLGPGWPDALGDDARGEVEKLFEDRRRTNTQITMLECLLLPHRLRLLKLCPGILERIGYGDAATFRGWKERLIDLRNRLAHGGTLLHADPDPLRAIDLFTEVRGFAERLWRAAAQRVSVVSG